MVESFDDFDERNWGAGRTSEFSALIERALSRRDVVKAGVAGLASLIEATGVVASSGGSAFLFQPVAANSRDTITLPEGYSWRVLVSWGDSLFPRGVAFDHTTRGTAASQGLAFGDNNDGMELYPLDGDRGILAVNNEYTNLEWLLPSGRIETEEDILKSKNAHGVSFFEIRRRGRSWSLVRESRYNRRITPDTPMEMCGVARGSEWLQTSQDPAGVEALGTWNNCGSGRTPWGTYLTCEENFNGYFASTDDGVHLTARQRRYGIGKRDWGYGWYRQDSRFDIAIEPNECHRAGYVVEIDPLDPRVTPKKRTSLGRFKHENAACVVNKDGRVVVYMGDDERGEYLYKFVSSGRYTGSRENMDLLDDGVLYVARFEDAGGDLHGRGRWIALEHGAHGLVEANGFSSQAEIQVFAREAATHVGATTMDRPEWVAVHPHTSSVFCCLTNNKQRGKAANRGGVAQVLNGPNPRLENHYGQIVRWRPDDDDHAGEGFSWDLFVLAGNPLVKSGLYRGSANITIENMFNAPDGLVFDDEGRLWIQTDGAYTNKGDFVGMGNNQMLCADPETGEIRRFMVGPVACEITGAVFADGGRTLFVGIQHPGEGRQGSSFPGGDDTVPRSSVVVVTKDDGGVIGS